MRPKKRRLENCSALKLEAKNLLQLNVRFGKNPKYFIWQFEKLEISYNLSSEKLQSNSYLGSVHNRRKKATQLTASSADFLRFVLWSCCFHGSPVLRLGLHLKLCMRNVFFLMKSGWISVPWLVFPTLCSFFTFREGCIITTWLCHSEEIPQLKPHSFEQKIPTRVYFSSAIRKWISKHPLYWVIRALPGYIQAKIHAGMKQRWMITYIFSLISFVN